MKFSVVCPHCDKEHQVTLTIKGTKKKAPPKPSPTSGLIWPIVQHYLDVKNVTDKVQIDSQKGRLCATAKKYLMSTGNDIDLIKAKISKAKAYFDGKNISWTLETVGKYWGEVDKTDSGYSGWN